MEVQKTKLKKKKNQTQNYCTSDVIDTNAYMSVQNQSVLSQPHTPALSSACYLGQNNNNINYSSIFQASPIYNIANHVTVSQQP